MCKEGESREEKGGGLSTQAKVRGGAATKGSEANCSPGISSKIKPTSNEVGFILRADQGICLAVIVAKYRSVGLSGGARAPRPTEAGNDIPNEYLPVGALPAIAYLPTVARRRADEERPYHALSLVIFASF